MSNSRSKARLHQFAAAHSLRKRILYTDQLVKTILACVSRGKELHFCRSVSRLSRLARTEPQVTQDEFLDMRDPRIHVFLGRELAIQQVCERVSIRQEMVSQRGNRDVELDRIDSRAKVAGPFALLQEVVDIAE